MDKSTRRWFDRILEEVIVVLPQLVRETMEQVPLYVEDHPSRSVIRQFKLRDRREISGLFTGVPLKHKVPDYPIPGIPDRVTIYREGILWAAGDRNGYVDEERLKKEIRKTILHEYGHYFGMSEAELASYGYG